jgi:hypothetical protein
MITSSFNPWELPPVLATPRGVKLSSSFSQQTKGPNNQLKPLFGQ